MLALGPPHGAAIGLGESDLGKVSDAPRQIQDSLPRDYSLSAKIFFTSCGKSSPGRKRSENKRESTIQQQINGLLSWSKVYSALIPIFLNELFFL
jgi:hypothetical protein